MCSSAAKPQYSEAFLSNDKSTSDPPGHRKTALWAVSIYAVRYMYTKVSTAPRSPVDMG